MTEIARLLRAAFEDLGVATAMMSHELPRPTARSVNLVVAPHEFFPLFPDASEAQCLAAASTSVLVSVEQPGTPWFGIGNVYSRVAAAVLDISALAVEELRVCGIEAHVLRLGYHESWDRWGGDDSTARAHEILYLGSLTERREKILSTLAPVLATTGSTLIIHDGLLPVTSEAKNFVYGDAKHDLLARSLVLLNIHRSEAPYFEWHRQLGAMANGCLVLTEPSEAYAPLVPWEHFAVSPTEQLGDFTTLLLSAPSLRRRLARQAYDFVRRELLMTNMLRPLLPILESVALSGSGRSGRKSRRLGVRETAADDHVPRAGGHVARPPLLVPASDPVERGLKLALIGQSRLERELQRLKYRADSGEDQRMDVVETLGFATAQPTVSVIVPVYNYASYVESALISALNSRDIALELIVVDDHSTDDSAVLVEKLMRRRPHTAVRLVLLAVNSGVSYARNLGVEQARGEFLFFLDADNRVYPDGLRKLRVALADDPGTAFAYGILSVVGDASHLISSFPWDLNRLARGNYIDAMVMMRRSVFVDVGGFSVDLQDVGWEDYELWLRLASHGHRAAFVSTIVGDYRVHAAQRTRIVNLDVASLYEHLRSLYPELPWDFEIVRSRT